MFRKLHDQGVNSPVLPLTVTIDGLSVTAEAGESVAAVLLRLDPPLSRTTPVRGSPRAPYCMMGVCFDCLAIVDGVASIQTCLVEVRDGMRVDRQRGARVATPAADDTKNSDALATASHRTPSGSVSGGPIR